MRFVALCVALSTCAQQPSPADFKTAEHYLAGGQFAETLRILERAPDRSPRWHLLASQAYEGLNDPAQAVREAEAALALEPANLAAHLQLGQIFLSHNTPSAALEVFDEAATIFPGAFLVKLGRGLALKELQRYDEAASTLRECLSAQPGSSLAFDGLGTALLHGLHYEELKKESEAFRRQNPADFRGPYYLAAALDGLGEADRRVEDLLTESIAKNPKFAASYGLLGKTLVRQNRMAEAIAPLEKAIALRPDHLPSHLNLAKAYRAAGREADAAREYQTVRELNEKGQQPAPSLIYRRGARQN